MYYIYSSPSSKILIHVTKDRSLYPEERLIESFQFGEELEEYAKMNGYEICWCDVNPLPRGDFDEIILQ